jgi:hypothetical protein
MMVDSASFSIVDSLDVRTTLILLGVLSFVLHLAVTTLVTYRVRYLAVVHDS